MKENAAVADAKSNSTDSGERAEREKRLRDLAYKPDSKKPNDVSDAEWRQARLEAGHMVLIRSHFKAIFLVPMFLMSVICAIGSYMTGETGDQRWGLAWSLAFVFYMNIFIFEWSRAWTIALMSFFFGTICLCFAVNSESFPVFQKLYSFMTRLELDFSEQAYVFFAIFFGFCAGISWIKTRLNYIVIEHNEMQVYRNALIGDRERISMLNPSIEIVVPDMLEYIHPFYRSGTVIIRAPDKTIVLENVLGIRRIESLTDKIGSALMVHIEKDEDDRRRSSGNSSAKS